MSQANVTPVAGELHSLFCMAGSKFLNTETTLYNPYFSEAHYLNQEITVFFSQFSSDWPPLPKNEQVGRPDRVVFLK